MGLGLLGFWSRCLVAFFLIIYDYGQPPKDKLFPRIMRKERIYQMFSQVRKINSKHIFIVPEHPMEQSSSEIQADL